MLSSQMGNKLSFKTNPVAIQLDAFAFKTFAWTGGHWLAGSWTGTTKVALDALLLLWYHRPQSGLSFALILLLSSLHLLWLAGF